jgi:gliding motility-associated-like protein
MAHNNETRILIYSIHFFFNAWPTSIILRYSKIKSLSIWMRILYLYITAIFILLLHGAVFAQGNRLVLTSSVPTELTVCGGVKTFSLQLYNPSPNQLTGVSLTVTMPSGMLYTPGTVTNATEQNISNLSTPVFSVTDLATLTGTTITFSASAGCDVMAYLANGNPARNISRVNYTANGFNTYDGDTSFTYLIKQPNVSITSVSNQSYSGNVGDTYTRCITITNGGLGALSQFNFTDQHGTGIQVNSIDKGTRTTTGNTELVLLTGADFAAIGNGNNLLESGESITLCENVTITNCISVSSSYIADWGCNGQKCQSSVSSANVIFPNLTPNLSVTPQSSQGACYGMSYPNAQSLTITNNGQGQATNVKINVFQSAGAGFYNVMISALDANSFTYQVGAGPLVPVTPVVNALNANYSCLQGMLTGDVNITLPDMAAGQTIVLRWNTYSCCHDLCGGGSPHAGTNNGWSYQGSYSNVCQNNYIIPLTYARGYNQMYADMVNNSSPGSIASGQTLPFSFLFSNDIINYASTGAREWHFVVTLPSCVSYAGNARIVAYDNTTVWAPASVTPFGNTLTIVFSGNQPFNRVNGDLRFDLAAACGGCGSGGVGNLRLESYFVSDPTCGCQHSVSCINQPLTVVCPTQCQGMNISGFSIARTSYGQRDNNNDGVPEAGAADLNLIRTDRAMFGDTLTGAFTGTVLNGPYQYMYAQSAISNGNNYVSFVDGALTVTRGGATYACNINNAAIANTGAIRTFQFDLSVAGLIASGCLPAGFTYQSGDIISFKPRYRVGVNTGGGIVECRVSNEFYVSNIANPVNAADKLSCNNYDGAFTIIGYYYTNWGPDNYTVSSCNNLTLTQNYYLSIGPCCQQYAGGNLFPYEYRRWAWAELLRVIPPKGYTFVSARFNHVRTSGNQQAVGTAWQALTPVNNSPDTFDFNTQPFFSQFGGAFQESDDGFYGTLETVLTPSCAVVRNVASSVYYDWYFGESPNLVGSNSTNNTPTNDQDYVTYLGPDLFIQSQLPSVLAQDNTAQWDVSLSNITGAAAQNVWVAGPQISGVAITEVFDVTNNTIIAPSAGGIYQLGALAGSATVNLRIRASYTSCQPDSIILHAGWNCGSYPSSVANYPCSTDKIRLTLSPQIPTLIANITSPSGTVDLCDTASYIVEGVNIQLGTAYNLKLRVILPTGVIITPGSSAISYPAGAPYAYISNPVLISGTTYEWDLSAINATLGTDGLKGILQSALNSVKIKFNVRTDCDYTSGSLIGFNFNGRSACGLYTGQEVSLSSQLAVTGADKPYDAGIVLGSTYISPCVSSTPLSVKVTNNGPLSTSSLDSVVIILPEHAAYVANSFTGTYNAPPAGSFNQYYINNQQYLVWQLPAGIAAADSIKFNIAFDVIADSLVCGIENIEAYTISAKNLLCIQNSQSCGIKVRTSDTILPIYVYKASLQFTTLSATAHPSALFAEELSVSGSLYNYGETIVQGKGLIIKYYRDADANGVYSLPDLLLHTDTITSAVNTAAAFNFNTSFGVAAGNGCNLIALIQTNDNSCVCSNTEIFAGSIPYLNAGNDSSLCSGGVIPIGTTQVAGYAYSWTPPADISNAANGPATFSQVNFTGSNVVNTLMLTTNRMNCTTSDTLWATVYPKVTLDITGLLPAYCINEAAQSLTLVPAGGILSGNGVTGNTFAPAAAGAGNHTLTYNFTDINGCAWDTTATTVVNPLPVVSFTGLSPAYCVDAATATLTGNPAAGVFTGSGIAGNDFTPAAAGTGAHTVIYTFTDANNCTNADTQAVIVTALPLGSFTGLSATYCNYPGADTLTGIPSGGIFSGPGMADSLFTMNNAGVGIHSIVYEYTDNSGCYSADTQQTEVYAVPVPSAGGDTAVCFHQSAQLAATGGVSYVWSNGNNNATQTVTPSITTTYKVTVTNNNNCTATDSVVVTANPLPDIAFTPVNVRCFGFNDGSITTAISSGSQPFSYSWSNSTSNPGISALAPGTYTLTVSDVYACADTDSVAITEPALLTANEIWNDSVSCFGRSDGASALVVAGGVTPYNIVWNSTPPQQNDSLLNVPAGTYIATVTDANNCTVQATVLIEEPSLLTANIQNVVNLLCYQVPQGSAEVVASGSIPPYTYAWSSAPAQQTAVAAGLPAGNYTVTVTDNIGCSVTAATAITEPAQLVMVLADSSAPMCNGDNNGFINMSTAGGVVVYTYAWSHDATWNNGSAPQLAVGTYTASVTDANGCMDSMTISLAEPTPLTLSLIATDLTCYNANDGTVLAAAAGGSGGYLYNWTGTATVSGNAGSGLEEGMYAVTVTDAHNCTISDYAGIKEPAEMVIHMMQDATVRLGHAVLLDNTITGGVGGFTYNWQPVSGLSCSKCPLPVSTVMENTAYQLFVEDSTGCRAEAAVNIYVINDKLLYIPNTFSPNGDGNNDIFGLFTEAVQQYRMMIFNRWGEKIFETVDVKAGWDGYYNGQLVDPGSYVYEVSITWIDNQTVKRKGTIFLMR